MKAYWGRYEHKNTLRECENNLLRREEVMGRCNTYEGVTKSFRTGRLERELQMVQLSATRCSCVAIL